jgi:hypothetical protein
VEQYVVRSERERAVMLGLAALQEVVEQVRKGAAPAGIQLRALLALLHVQGKGDHAACRAFWDGCRVNMQAPETPAEAMAARHGGTPLAAHQAWCAIARSCGFNPEGIGFNETIERLRIQARHAEAVRAVREAAHRPKPNRSCGWL